MKYLESHQYGEIVKKVIGKNIRDAATYFRAEYIQHKELNPDFSSKLFEVITELTKQFENEVAYLEAKYIETGRTTYPDGTPRDTDFGKKGFPLSKFFNGITAGDTRRLTTESLKYLIEGASEFIKLINENTPANEPDPVNQNNLNVTKLKWTGTPGEFGAIFHELIKRGYIEQVRDLKNTVRIFERFFEVNNEYGKPVEIQYLYKCFGEKKREYYPTEFKIPTTDNEGKKK